MGRKLDVHGSGFDQDGPGGRVGILGEEQEETKVLDKGGGGGGAEE